MIFCVKNLNFRCNIENIFMKMLNQFNTFNKPEFIDSFSINVFIIRKCIISGNVTILRHKLEHGKTFSFYCDKVIY